MGTEIVTDLVSSEAQASSVFACSRSTSEWFKILENVYLQFWIVETTRQCCYIESQHWTLCILLMGENKRESKQCPFDASPREHLPHTASYLMPFAIPHHQGEPSLLTWAPIHYSKPPSIWASFSLCLGPSWLFLKSSWAPTLLYPPKERH